jgi:HAD superfamily hydrolase (TIGR01509 family)
MEPAAARRAFMTQNLPIEALASSLDRSELAANLAQSLRSELASLYIYPDVAEALALLSNRGKKVAVCSNLAAGYGEAVRALLPQIRNFVFSYEVGAVKPEPAIYAEVRSRLSVAASEVLFIGDSLRCDVEGPVACGMQGRLLSRRAGQTLTELIAPS